MSLPPALLQRLSQRGLVKKKNESKKQGKLNFNNEEIIAEDYDDLDADQRNQNVYNDYNIHYQSNVAKGKKKNTEENFWLERMKEHLGVTGSYLGYKNCPNKYNIWHKCTLYCVNRWEDSLTEPTEKYRRRYQRLIRKYPLPPGWTEVFDPGCRCFYFSNPENSLVSWLPPTHPKSRVSKSAAVYRSQLENARSKMNIENELSNKRDYFCALPVEQDPEFDTKASLKKQKYRDIDRALRKRKLDT